MPANLTQQYHKAEQEYRRASTPDEELRCLQVMLRELPKHKGTDKLQADLKQRISKAKSEAESAKSAKKGHGVRIPRQGAGRVILLGGPNAGKSQLMTAITRAKPEVAEYPFTTREPIPGMMPWEDIQIQLIDTPPITADFLEPYVQGLIRGSELALLLVDLGADDGIELCQELWDRLNSTKTRLGRESYLDQEDIGQSYTRCFLVPNKIDADEASDRLEMLHELIDLELEEFDYPDFQLAVHCSGGTYVRSLGRDLGRHVGSAAVMTALSRTRIGEFSLRDSIAWDSLDRETIEANLVAPVTALPDLPCTVVDDATIAKLRYGSLVELDEVAELVAAVDSRQRLMAIMALRGSGQYSPSTNFVSYWEDGGYQSSESS